MKILLPILCVFLTFLISAQTITRGPYMQTPTENSIIIKWRTDVPTDSKVAYGTDVNNLIETIVLTASTSEHTVYLSGLDDYTTYFYSVGNTTNMLTTPSIDYTFRTNPIPGTKVPIRAWAIGDFGKGNTQQVQVKQSYENYADTAHTDVWFWLGDNAYADGKDHEYDEKVFNVAGFSDMFSSQPFWPTPGNHDYIEVWNQSTLLNIPYSNIPFSQHEGPYYEIVDVPEQAEAGGEPSNYELFYSFDYGNVHFLSLNSEVYDYTQTYDGINQMKAWIEQDLMQNEQTFTVAYFHQPPYSKGSHNSDDVWERVMIAMREKVIPLLEEYDIDLVVCGHSHVFERSHLIHGHYGNSGSYDPGTMLMDGNGGDFTQGNAYVKDDEPTTADGTVYVVCGNSGSKTSSSTLDHPVMYYAAGGDTEVGSFVMDIYRNRLDGKYLHASGQILDEFTIVKQDMEVEINDISICTGDAAIISPQIIGGSDDLSFNWSTLGSTDPTPTVSGQDQGTHTLTFTDNISGQVENLTFNITQGTNMSLSFSNDTLWASGNNGYQWYLDGALIPGETNNYLLPTLEADYTVSSLNGTCLSSSYNYEPLSIEEQTFKDFTIYPNPSKGEVNISLNETDLPANYEVTDLSGKTVEKGSLIKKQTKLDLSKLPSGTYMITVSQKQKSQTLKIVLNK